VAIRPPLIAEKQIGALDPVDNAFPKFAYFSMKIKSPAALVTKLIGSYANRFWLLVVNCYPV